MDELPELVKEIARHARNSDWDSFEIALEHLVRILEPRNVHKPECQGNMHVMKPDGSCWCCHFQPFQKRECGCEFHRLHPELCSYACAYGCCCKAHHPQREAVEEKIKQLARHYSDACKDGSHAAGYVVMEQELRELVRLARSEPRS